MKTFLSVGAGIVIYLSLFSSSLRAQPGSLDITFNPGTGVGQYLYCIALQTNGQILVGGSFNTVNGITNNAVARLNSDGSVDTSFNVGQGPSDRVNCLAVQPDGRIVIGGNFSTVNNVTDFGVARLRTDGSVDISFQPATFLITSINAVAIQNDGKILIAGFINQSLGPKSTVARLNADGSFDSSFNRGTNAASNTPADMALQSNGQILVAVPFITVNGITRTNVARLNSDGTIDTTFTADPMIGSPGHVNCVLALTNGQVLIGGSFDTINGYTRQGIARLNTDGTLDTLFGRAYSPYDPYVSEMALQADGNILISDNVNPNPHRLNANGLDDSSFNSGTGVDQSIQAIIVQPDGKILIGGGFTSYNHTNINRIARLNGDNSTSTNLQFLTANTYFGTYLQGTVSNTYRIEWTGNLNTPSLWTPLFNVTLQTNPQFILDPNPASGQRFYRAVALP